MPSYECCKKGRKLSEEHKMKCSIALKGRVVSAETRKGISERQMGHTVSEEARRKISIGNTGKIRSEETHERLRIARNNHGQLPHSEETRNKIRLSHLTEEVKQKTRQTKESHGGYRGPKSPRWRGGIARLPYPYKFIVTKEIVRKRDNNRCMLCGRLTGYRKLDIHHIDYVKTNCIVTNLVSLCNSCHTKTNNNRKFWTEYFIGLLAIEKKEILCGL